MQQGTTLAVLGDVQANPNDVFVFDRVAITLDTGVSLELRLNEVDPPVAPENVQSLPGLDGHLAPFVNTTLDMVKHADDLCLSLLDAFKTPFGVGVLGFSK